MAEAKTAGIVFMGSSPFSRIILESLYNNPLWEIKGVYTQPDKKSGRGLKNSKNPVKDFCLQYDIPVFQPVSFRSDCAVEELRQLAPAFLAVAAYGRILPAEILEIPAIAPLNVHASLLPLYRGAAPIQRAIQESWGPDAMTGVSIMRMAPELDAGPVYAQQAVKIGNCDYQEVEEMLAQAGASLLNLVMAGLLEKRLTAVEQEHDKASWAPVLSSSESALDWHKSALEIDARIRAFSKWPGSDTTLAFTGKPGKIRVKIEKGQPGEAVSGASPGEVHREKNCLKIACKDRFYIIEKLKPQDGKIMTAAAFANGHCPVKAGFCGIAE